MQMNWLTRSLPVVIFLLSLNVLAQKNAVEYVNPFIGTGGHGHTYPGATLPFGMVQLSPDTRLEGWDGCGGYHYDDEYIYGFSHTHLNGTGVPDLCDILLMPGTGDLHWNNGADNKPGYRSKFHHNNELAEPGYYRVFLDDYRIKAELTATTRVGLHQYTFPDAGQVHILLDLLHRDHVIESSLHVISNTEIEGLRRSGSWAEDQYVYFVARFSKPFDSCLMAIDDAAVPALKSAEKKKNLKSCVWFNVHEGEKILVKVGISAVSYEGARKNLEKELPGWDFENTRKHAFETWKQALSKIDVSGGTENQKAVFYTALYHCMVQPNTFTDVDGKYRGMDKQIHTATDYTQYTVFSLWDTYRAWHPLMTIIDQARTLDYIRTFLAQYEQGGYLPVWELDGNETNCMIGYHSIPVIVDAYLKGIKGFDAEKALEAMKKSANRENAGLRSVAHLGYIPSDIESESASKTLEYAYDDWCIAQFAKAIGHNDDYKLFIRRGQNYKNLFDPSSKHMRARINGGWYSPFDPTEVNYNWTEANSWQYSFTATQDISGLIALHGGKENFAGKLDELFHATSQTSGRNQSDITGMIGQYAHGNEPSHHLAYLYPFAGQAWKTQELVHSIMNDFYKDIPDGLIGNEDCGQMSAWAVLSAMGFYPVNPGSDFYVIGSPMFNLVTLHLENGKTFVIRAQNLDKQNFYIQSARLNGKKYNAAFIRQQDIMKGGELTFEMGSKPNQAWGTGKKNEPVTSINDNLIVPVPYVDDPTKTFTDTKPVAIKGMNGARIYYLADDGNKEYQQPILFKETGKLRFYAQSNGTASKWATSEFIRIKNDRDITLSNPPAPQYSGSGPGALVDGLRGNDDYRVGGWLGFEKVNLEALIDLRSEKKISRLSAGFLQDVNSWIFMPTEVEYFSSEDGKNFTSLGIAKNNIPVSQEGTQIKNFDLSISPVQARYIKAIARNRGSCPEGHKGFPNPCWIFCDEITIE